MSYDPLKNEEMKIWFSKNDFKVCPFDDQSAERAEISIEIFFV